MRASVITMSEYRNASAAVEDVDELSEDGRSLLNIPANLASPYVSVEPHTHFEAVAGMAEIKIDLDRDLINSGVSVYRANQNSAYVFQQLDTQIVDGQAVAQTDQGGVFVAGSGVNYSLVVGLVVAGVVLLVVALMVVATIVYFVVRPEKWKSTKSSVKKAQMKVKRSFARQV